jgi:hypothetical protein
MEWVDQLLLNSPKVKIQDESANQLVIAEFSDSAFNLWRPLNVHDENPTSRAFAVLSSTGIKFGEHSFDIDPLGNVTMTNCWIMPQEVRFQNGTTQTTAFSLSDDFVTNYMLRNGVLNNPIISASSGTPSIFFTYPLFGLSNRVAYGSGGNDSLYNIRLTNINASKIWDAGNDGQDSGLDADLLDGNNSLYFLPSNVFDSFVAAELGTNNWQSTFLWLLAGYTNRAASGISSSVWASARTTDQAAVSGDIANKVDVDTWYTARTTDQAAVALKLASNGDGTFVSNVDAIALGGLPSASYLPLSIFQDSIAMTDTLRRSSAPNTGWKTGAFVMVESGVYVTNTLSYFGSEP